MQTESKNTARIDVQPSGQACGALITGVDLSAELDARTIHAIRAAWMQHHVIAFEQQQLNDDDLVRITRYFGALGEEPFFGTIDGNDHVVALTRLANEKAPLFAENWHSDWSFLEHPPVGTLLYSLVIPPVGGNTGFINQQMALAHMPQALRDRLQHKIALHSAAAAYAPDGMYGDKETEADRSMKIRFSEEARDVRAHPLILRHPENQRDTLLGCVGYICGIEGLEEAEAFELLFELYEWQTREEFQYIHQWQPDMLVMWDNRSVLHRAFGGYEGYDRILHRTTIAPDPSKFLQA
jgi:taurine dioxygenase